MSPLSSSTVPLLRPPYQGYLQKVRGVPELQLLHLCQEHPVGRESKELRTMRQLEEEKAGGQGPGLEAPAALLVGGSYPHPLLQGGRLVRYLPQHRGVLEHLFLQLCRALPGGKDQG